MLSTLRTLAGAIYAINATRHDLPAANQFLGWRQQTITTVAKNKIPQMTPSTIYRQPKRSIETARERQRTRENEARESRKRQERVAERRVSDAYFRFLEQQNTSFQGRKKTTEPQNNGHHGYDGPC